MHACKTLLAYFHFACGGTAPLKLHESKGQIDPSVVSLEHATYADDVGKELKKQGTELRQLKNKPMYKNEMYWCFQALCDDWDADMTHVGEIDALSEDDFLIS